MNALTRATEWQRPTLADVIERLKGAELDPVRRRDLVSAVVRVAAIVGAPPETIVVDLPTLSAALTEARKQGASISAKTLQNLRANLAAAMAVAEVKEKACWGAVPISAQWRDLLDRIPDQGIRTGVSRFSRWCSGHGIEPDGVDDAVITRFEAALADSLVKKPREAFGVAVRCWNRAHHLVPGLAGRPVTGLLNGRAPVRVDLSTLPASFCDDLAAYLAWLGSADPFDERARGKALATSTLRLRKEQIHTVVDIAVRKGIAPARVVSLAAICDPEVVRLVFAELYGRPNGEAYAAGVGTTLLSLAREWVKVDDGQLAVLKGLVGKLKPVRPGLTAKNKRTLQRLDDPERLAALLALPQKLWRAAACDRCPPKRRLPTYQVALAIAILLRAPIRMKNLTSLRFGAHITFPFGRKDQVWVSIPAAEVKNHQPFEAELTGEVAEMLHEYATRILPRHTGKPAADLFVSTTAKRKTAASLSAHISATIEDHLGFRVNPHAFRHLAAKVLLDAHPGNLEGPRQLLGHLNPKTTANFYSSFDSSRAVKLYDEVLARQRDQMGAPARKRRSS
jgi:integrase